MVRYFWEVFTKGFWSSLEAIGQPLQVLLWAFLVSSLTLLLVWHRNGWQAMRANLLKTVVEVISIGLVAWLPFLAAYVLRASYTRWKAESNHVVAIEKERDGIKAQLDAERDQNHPRFEITHGSTITGGMTIITETGEREEHTSVFIPVTVYNHGSPSVLRGTRLIVTLQDGTEVEGERIVPSQKELIFKDLNLRFSRDQSLAIKGSASPIPTGGLCDGFVTFALPPGLREKLQTAILKLIIYDVDTVPYEVTIDMKDKGGPKYLITPPSLLQKEK